MTCFRGKGCLQKDKSGLLVSAVFLKAKAQYFGVACPEPHYTFQKAFLTILDLFIDSLYMLEPGET
jgi:hypothetical protein